MFPKFLPALLLAGIMVLCVSIPLTNAHTPPDVTIEYDYEQQTLNVTITHPVSDPNTHYIERVEILVNGEEYDNYTYTSQPTNNQFTYNYSVIAEDGDTIDVTAFCSIAGSQSDSTVVDAPEKDMELSHSPDVDLMDESTSQTFVLTIESEGDPVEEATLEFSIILGTVSDIEESGGGDYNFTYHAPVVDEDQEDTINITSSADGFNNGTHEFNITIHNVIEEAPVINITVTNQPAEVDEETTLTLAIELESEGDPLEGATIEITPENVQADDPVEDGGGDYSFDITTPSVDENATATINISVSKDGYETSYFEFTFTIVDLTEPPKELVLNFNPDPNPPVVDEGEERELFVTLTSEGDPVEGADVTLTSDTADLTAVADLGDGEYSFTLTAPAVENDTTIIVNVSAEKDGYEDLTDSLTVTVKTVEEPDERLVLNGVISPGEYIYTWAFDSGNLEIHWKIVGDEISIAIWVKSTGWVSLGIDPTTQMKDADMIFAWVDDNGGVHIFDAFATGPNGPHPPDDTIGGTDDILEYGGREVAQTTVIEFKRSLRSDDERDKDIPANGPMTILWAYSSQDDFDAVHTARGTETLIMDQLQKTDGDDGGDDDGNDDGFIPFIQVPFIIMGFLVATLLSRKKRV